MCRDVAAYTTRCVGQSKIFLFAAVKLKYGASLIHGYDTDLLRDLLLHYVAVPSQDILSCYVLRYDVILTDITDLLSCCIPNINIAVLT